ncbi:PREDICTED: probable prolyl 4-hydroxylase 9 [Tarenaya hassleriana]|uniref:probable prolyl 4-hydroxylase 9 n=1 Tax=Tarenaya hassleriana TaxID=28532 RepID=UPI00053C3D62|nr:PREDICTED: probable prolyl 4-hydroxylase 9 [Tarenaya hassleriana]
MRANVKGKWRFSSKRLGFPYVFVACTFFFVIGFSFSNLLSQGISGENPRRRSVREEKDVFDPMPRGETGNDSVAKIPFQVLSWMPRALYFPNFATPEQCQSIIDMAKPLLKPSRLALREGETVENTQGVRTSSGVFIGVSEDKSGLLKVIEEKIAMATMIPTDNYEAFNILRYQLNQKYSAHYDAFNPAEYGPQKSQRVATLLLYLSNTEEGGETMFPYENAGNMDGNYDYEECIGLRVKPRQGDAVLFYSVFPNGTIDATSLHGSCPVIKGEKWVATKWIRDQMYEDFAD